MASLDRRAAVANSTSVNGIDFVEVTNSAQTVLSVHFLNAVPVQGSFAGAPTITGGETITSVTVLPIADTDWGWDDGHVVLTLHVAAPGDFSTYTLSFPASPVLDLILSGVAFSFKANCPSDLDCETPAPACPPATGLVPPITYLAKDFLSFRQALLDFSTLSYPNWLERSEADFGVMFAEALSAVADELSYTQDRIAGESTLTTATQRRSVLRHARLVDYELLPAQAASTMLQFDVASTTTSLPTGLAVIAPGPDGTPVTFETGMGLFDTVGPQPASAAWNRAPGIPAYWFDASQQCLPAGAVQIDVYGHGFNFQPGQALLIETAADSTADAPLRQIVHLLAQGDPAGLWAEEIVDEIFACARLSLTPPYLALPAPPPAAAPTQVTRLRIQAQDRLTAARDLSRSLVIGNLITATQGSTVAEGFVIGPIALTTPNPPPVAVERLGPRPATAPGICGTAPAIRLYTLSQPLLTWLPATDGSGLPAPEIILSSGAPPVGWSWCRSLLTATEFSNGFTIDPVSYRRVTRNSDLTAQFDYDGDAGSTIRFGDGVFGVNPEPGAAFMAQYRYGGGGIGNVAAGAISQLSPAALATGLYQAVMNPFAAAGGADAQTIQSAQRLAPQAFQATQYRAVLAADYAQAADTLSWVKSAGTQFRWTGSWLTTFTTAQPAAAEQATVPQTLQLIQLLNRYRMAGTESYVPGPDYVSIDLQIILCATADVYAAAVEQAVFNLLSPTGPNAAKAFFAVSLFSFGQPLQRSALEAAIQAIPGVAGILCIHVRLRDLTSGFVNMGDQVSVGTNQILRCDNDPSRPGNGALSITVQGGR